MLNPTDVGNVETCSVARVALFPAGAQGDSFALFPPGSPSGSCIGSTILSLKLFKAHTGITCDLVSFILYHMAYCMPCDGQPGPAFPSGVNMVVHLSQRRKTLIC